MIYTSGIKDSKRLFDELDQVKRYLEAHPEITFIVFAGDYFDCKLSLTDPATFYAMSFFNSILEIIKKRNGTIRMIQGTRSHELNQLQLFEPLQTSIEYDFRIIKECEEESLFGLNILYIPEEYPENADEYYGPFKAEGKEYNMIFGHGTWDFVAQQSQIEHGQRTDIFTAPVFMWKEWKHTVPNGFISFGHIHGRNTYGKKIFYSGSFTRWGYGERSERGFTHFTYDNENKTYNVEYINNTEAPRFDAIDIISLGLDKMDSIKDIQKVLDEEVSKTDYLRIDLSGLSKENIQLIKKYYDKNPNVKLEVRTKETANLRESKEAETSEFEKYHYITKRQVPLNEMIKRFCKEEYNKEISLETINNILVEVK